MTPRARTGRGAAPAGRAGRASGAARHAERPPAASLAAIPWRHPAFLSAIVACAASLVLSASYRLYDTDFWTLLVTGKAMWKAGGIPMTDQWTWPTLGEPQVMSSWLFRWRLWPLWEHGGVPGLFVWRWVVTLATFGLLAMAARRMGARGFLALPLLAWCGVAYRLRTDIRPELAAGALFALALWLLESERSRKVAAREDGSVSPWRRIFADRRVWLVPLACVWANAHLSWYLLFVLWGLYLLDGRGGRPWRLVAFAAAATFVNPWGWRALWQPFEFALFWRNERLFRAIAELQPLDWRAHVRDGLPLLFALWAALAIWRWRRRGFDVVEALGGFFFVIAAISSQRFLGNAVAFAAPFLVRDAAEWAAARAWSPWLGGAWVRAGLAAATCFAVGIAEWTRHELPLGIALDTRKLPVAACDFIEARGIRGRALNDLHLGGYLAWRAWPGRDRLPFMTTQPENARPDDRRAYAAALIEARGWQQLQIRHRFEWVLLDRNPSPGERLLAWVAADTAFAPVFMDDAAIVFVRRRGALAAVADSFAFRTVPADPDARRALIFACEGDSALRAAATAEFARQAASSSQSALAEQALGTLALMEGRIEQGRAHLERALAIRPTLPGARRMLEAARQQVVPLTR